MDHEPKYELKLHNVQKKTQEENLSDLGFKRQRLYSNMKQKVQTIEKTNWISSKLKIFALQKMTLMKMKRQATTGRKYT